jgi:hypothetical protein
MAGEPDTKKLVRPVRRETHRNLVGNPIKARCVHPIAVLATRDIRSESKPIEID